MGNYLILLSLHAQNNFVDFSLKMQLAQINLGYFSCDSWTVYEFDLVILIVKFWKMNFQLYKFLG